MAAVYWITGLSGAGKTTIGKAFYERLREKYRNTVFLDGDSLRQVFGEDLGYTEEERRKCAMRYGRLCKMLQEQGINVICCTISMFDSIREWNRGNIADYVEIYVRATAETLHRRDQKGLYSASLMGKKMNVASIDFCVEEPKEPDFILDNDGEFTPKEQVEKIWHLVRMEETGGEELP